MSNSDVSNATLIIYHIDPTPHDLDKEIFLRDMSGAAMSAFKMEQAFLARLPSKWLGEYALPSPAMKMCPNCSYSFYPSLWAHFFYITARITAAQELRDLPSWDLQYFLPCIMHRYNPGSQRRSQRLPILHPLYGRKEYWISSRSLPSPKGLKTKMPPGRRPPSDGQCLEDVIRDIFAQRRALDDNILQPGAAAPPRAPARQRDDVPPGEEGPAVNTRDFHAACEQLGPYFLFVCCFLLVVLLLFFVC